MRFLLIDDHPIVRDGLKRLLTHSFHGATVVEASNAREGMQRISPGPWDLVFLDIDLPDRSGLDLLRDLRNMAPNAPVLMVSGMLETEFGERALQAGAAGFVNKASLIDEVLVAIRRVRSGKKYISPDLGARLMEKRLNPGEKTAHEGLSVREFEVLRLLGDGRTVSEIAALLNLSVKTVSTYRTRVLEKLNLHTTAEIIRYALVHGLEK
jgi:DNA-binding NarL/FixJ family response regulator